MSGPLLGGLDFLGLLWRATVNSDGRKASFADAQRPRPRGHSALIENITRLNRRSRSGSLPTLAVCAALGLFAACVQRL